MRKTFGFGCPTEGFGHVGVETLDMTQYLIIGVDTGGTFTDLVIRTIDNRLLVAKIPGTPANPANSVIAAILTARERYGVSDSALLVHGTTVATNALLERKGARTALITTRGFKDVLAIGRQTRSSLYTFTPSRPAPLINAEDCFEVDERVDWLGDELFAISKDGAAALAQDLAARGYESAAVCFLFSYLNSSHEAIMNDALEDAGFMTSASHLVAPEPREYERTACTVGNAFVAPVLSRYLGTLNSRLDEVNCHRLRVMQSDGGSLVPGEAARLAIRTALSGPAGGVRAAEHLAQSLGINNLITFDMGGTSTDVAMLLDGKCGVVNEGQIGPTPLRSAMYDIHTVGAGGGSIACLDSAGALRVGPQSAGADPGPAAYGRGAHLTVTDANLLLGRLPAALPLAGAVRMDVARTEALFVSLAESMGVAAPSAAAAVIELANQTMARAVRHVTTERGLDVQRCTLLSFGGAGGLHACHLADLLGITRVVVPRYPGAFSAAGLCMSGVSREFVQQFPARTLLSGAAALLSRAVATLRQNAVAWMQQQGIDTEAWSGTMVADIRYRGQAYDLKVPGVIDPVSAVNEHALDMLISSFHALHRQRFGHADQTQPTEISALRLVAVDNQDFIAMDATLPHAPSQPMDVLTLYSNESWQEADLYWRPHLATGQQFAGPAIIAQEDATLYVPDGWMCDTHVSGNLILTSSGYKAGVQ